jgi:hypothetical protein
MAPSGARHRQASAVRLAVPHASKENLLLSLGAENLTENPSCSMIPARSAFGAEFHPGGADFRMRVPKSMPHREQRSVSDYTKETTNVKRGCVG